MRRIWILLSVIILYGFQGHAQPESPALVLSQFNALYASNTDSTVTALFEVGFAGETPEAVDIPVTFSVPGEITNVQVHDAPIFEALDAATIVAPNSVEFPCDLAPVVAIGHGPGWSQYKISPSLIGSHEIAGALSQQLTVTAQLEQAALDDIDANIFDTVLHRLPVVAITYRPSSASPFALSLPESAAALPRYLPTNIYLLADTPWLPEDSPLVSVDTSETRSSLNQIASMVGERIGWGDTTLPREIYQRAIESTLEHAEASAFIVHHASTTETTLPRLPATDDLAAANDWLAPLLEQRRVLTRLYTRDPIDGQMRLAPAPDYPPTTTDVSQRVDMVLYHGCATETLYDPALESRLPANRVYVEALRVYLPLPEGWTLLEYPNSQAPGERGYIATPAALTGQEAYWLTLGYREVTSPVLSLEPFRVPYMGDFEPAPAISASPLNWDDRSFAARAVGVNGVVWYWASSDSYPAGMNSDIERENAVSYANGVKISMIAPLEDYAASVELYDAILRYFTRYQFYTHPDLRHTLFLGDLGGHIEVGYPEGWRTINHPELGRLLLPTDAENPAAAPYVRITPLESGGERFDPQAAPEPFETETRRGFMRYGADRLHGTFRVEFSSPTSSFEDNERLLRLMSEAMRTDRYTDAEAEN